MTKLKQVLTMAMCAVLMFTAVACGGGRGEGDEIDANYEWYSAESIAGTNVKDSSELSDYKGQHKIDLTAWYTTGAGNEKKKNSSDDVVTAEIKRITGISINNEKSFDNKGMTADIRWNNLQSLGQYPDISYGSGWMDTEEVWDLTELVDKYCPTIKARMPSYVWNNENVNGGQTGKVYGIPYGLQSLSLSRLDPIADDKKTILFSHVNEYRPFIYVREDILKDAYPNALSSEDIENIYKEKGEFTQEQLFDVNVTSAKQFREEFLPAINNAIKNGGDKYKINNNRYVDTMLVTAGQDYDTWDFMGKLIPYLMGAGANSMNTNMSYWDKQTQKLESMLYQDFYKNEVYEWAKMINEGTVVSSEGMTTTHSQLLAELNSGYYAIGYLSNSYPTSLQCDWKGNTVKFRKVFLNIPLDESRFMYCGYGEPTVSSVKFLKSQVAESELAQLLMWMDFQCSRTADMLYAWGPDGPNALFTTDDNGVRTYKTEDLVQQMVFSTATMGDKVQRYNLSNGQVYSANPVLPFYYMAGSVYHPKATYDISSLKGMAESYYSAAIVLSEEVKSKFVGLKLNPSFHTWTNSHLKGIEDIWARRVNVEDDLKQLLIAGASLSTFNDKWQTLQNTLTQSGWTKTYFNGKVTNAFLTVNKDYLHQFLNDN